MAPEALANRQELPHLHDTVPLLVPTRDARSCGYRVSICCDRDYVDGVASGAPGTSLCSSK
jgi:hypothetical protein